MSEKISYRREKCEMMLKGVYDIKSYAMMIEAACSHGMRGVIEACDMLEDKIRMEMPKVQELKD